MYRRPQLFDGQPILDFRPALIAATDFNVVTIKEVGPSY